MDVSFLLLLAFQVHSYPSNLTLPFSTSDYRFTGDTRAIQPVILFSHKPLSNSSLDHIADVCKVIDVAVVPDTPGVCVAVTETFHDVASYHMLHADKQPDGSFSLTANSLEGRELPNEEQYTQARALLLSYFDNVDMVANAVKSAPKYGTIAHLRTLHMPFDMSYVSSKLINYMVSTISHLCSLLHSPYFPFYRSCRSKQSSRWHATRRRGRIGALQELTSFRQQTGYQ